MKRVKITKLPELKGGGTAMFGEQTPPKDNTVSPGPGSYHGGNTPEIKIKKTLEPTDREHATLEAELGETIITNLQGEGVPEFYTIGGKRHYNGGTPLNVPPNSFIFSRDKKLAIKDKEVLKMFNKPVKGTYTPAELSKSFDLNKYRKILLDPSADKIQIETAELMIKNFMYKLGALALAQESLKGFPNGIPAIAQAYMEQANIRPEELLEQPQPEEPLQEAAVTEGSEEQQELARFGGTQGLPNKRYVRITNLPKFDPGGGTGVGSYANPVGVQPIMPRLRAGEQVIQDPNTGQLLIIDRRGNVKGRLNMPQQNQGTADNSPDTEVNKSTKSTKRQNVPKDAVLHDPSKEGYDTKAVKEGHYIKENGRWYRVTGAKEKPYEGTAVEELDTKLKGDFGDLRKSYGRLENAIMNNPDLQDELFKKYQENVNQKKPKGVLKQSDIDAAKGLTKEQVVKNYLDAQKQIMIINAQKGNIGAQDTKDTWDQGFNSQTRLPKQYEKAASELGLDPFSVANTFAFQAAYIGMQDLKDNDKFKDYLNDYAIGDKTQFGLDDEGAGAKGRMTISGADGWWGNTTTGQAQMYMPEINEWEKEEVEDQAVKEEADVKHLPDTPGVQDPAKWWTQDIVNIAGDAYDLATLKKYDPWQATPQFEEAVPEFVDFRGTAARIGSAASAGAQQAATFAGPQAYAATFANVQKTTTDAILTAQEAEDKTNVGIANQFELANTQAKNQYNMYKAGLDTQLWDKNVIANQQFDNAKRALREKLRFDFNQGWTNKGMTQTMNALRDDFAVDPTTGYIHKKPGYNPIIPTSGANTTMSDAARKLMDENPGMTADEALKWAKADAGIEDNAGYPTGVDPSQFMYPTGANMPYGYNG